MRVGRCLLLLILGLGVAQGAHAEVFLQLDSAAQTGPEGSWVYDYSIHNTDASGSVFSLFLEAIAPSTFSGIPTGWGDQLVIGSTTGAGFAEWNAVESQYEVGPNEWLAGFSITSEYAPGTVQWAMYIDGGSASFLEGDILGPTAGIPEPMSLCLLGMAVGPVLAWGRRRRGSAKNATKIP